MNSVFYISFMVQNMFCSLAAFISLFSFAVYALNWIKMQFCIHLFLWCCCWMQNHITEEFCCIVYVQQHKNTVFHKCFVSFFSKLCFCCWNVFRGKWSLFALKVSSDTAAVRYVGPNVHSVLCLTHFVLSYFITDSLSFALQAKCSW